MDASECSGSPMDNWAREILNLLSKEVKRVGSLREGKEARKARTVFAPVTLHEEGIGKRTA